MRGLLFYGLLSVGLLFATSTTTKIANSQKDLHATASAKRATSRKLEKIAKDILATEKDISYLVEKITALGKDREATQKEQNRLKSELGRSQKELSETSETLKQKRQTYLKLLAEQFSVIFAMEQSHEPTQKSIISQEIYHAYKKHNAKVLASLQEEIGLLEVGKKAKLSLHEKMRSRIEYIAKQSAEYQRKRLIKKRLLKRLSADEEHYSAKLEKIEDRQDSLRNTLASLNILQAKEVKDARRRRVARKEAIAFEKARKKRLRREGRAYKQSDTIRKINSSYKKSNLYSYRGKKTISPIPGARIVKRFGTYIDPIYKIKVFNESVTLKAPRSNSKVQNVLNGKVVFAGKSSMLGKVVVVAHSGKMHTVYAGLSKIAPNIRVGRKIKKGYVLGKVARKLLFQATKNSKHLNPERLIRI